jgi:hypothetical protein
VDSKDDRTDSANTDDNRVVDTGDKTVDIVDVDDTTSLSGPTIPIDEKSKDAITIQVDPTPKPTEKPKPKIRLPTAVVAPGVVTGKPYLMLGALNEPHTGKMRGLSSINYKCYKQARNARLPPGSFRAMLSDKHQSLKYIVNEDYRHLPIVNLQGQMLFPSWNDMFEPLTTPYAFNPDTPLYSFNGKDVRQSSRWPTKKFWHGSHANGDVHKSKDLCNIRPSDNSAWKSQSPSKITMAASIINKTTAINEEPTTCDQRLIVLCVQIVSS